MFLIFVYIHTEYLHTVYVNEGDNILQLLAAVPCQLHPPAVFLPFKQALKSLRLKLTLAFSVQ